MRSVRMPASSPSFWPKWGENRPFALGLLIFIAYAAVFLLVQIQQTIRETRQIGVPEPVQAQITVEAEGRSSAVPDVATIRFGVESRADSVASAQAQNTRTMNALLSKIKELGIAEADIQTASYHAYEDKQWDGEEQELVSKGWVVSQQATVKVRDTDLVASVLQAAGENGATNISGPEFALDDESAPKDRAREDAIAQARERAEEIARQLGAELDGVLAYSEYASGGEPPFYRAGEAVGGAAPSPSVEPGSSEVRLTVSITYRLADPNH